MASRKGRRALAIATAAVSVVSAGAGAGEASAAEWRISELRPVGGSGIRAIVQLRRDGDRLLTEAVFAGLEDGARYDLAASAGPCGPEAAKRRLGLMGSTYGGTDWQWNARRAPRSHDARTRSVLVVAGGRVVACGTARAARPGPRFTSFRLHPASGASARGLVHLTRARRSAPWRVRGLFSGLPATAQVSLNFPAAECPATPPKAGWHEIPAGVVDSEGWDEVPEDLMFRVTAAGDVSGRLAGGLRSLRAAGLLDETTGQALSYGVAAGACERGRR